MLTNHDRRDWFRDMRSQDENWMHGYSKGRQDRLRSWAEFGLGYLLGRESHGIGWLVAIALFLFLVAVVIHFWLWIVAAIVARFFWQVGCYWWSKRPKPTKDDNPWDPEQF